MVVFGAIQNNNGACFAVLPRRRPENSRIGRGVEAGRGGEGVLVNKTVGDRRGFRIEFIAELNGLIWRRAFLRTG